MYPKELDSRIKNAHNAELCGRPGATRYYAEAVVALADELRSEREKVRRLETELTLAQVALTNTVLQPVVSSTTTRQVDAPPSGHADIPPLNPTANMFLPPLTPFPGNLSPDRQEKVKAARIGELEAELGKERKEVERLAGLNAEVGRQLDLMKSTKETEELYESLLRSLDRMYGCNHLDKGNPEEILRHAREAQDEVERLTKELDVFKQRSVDVCNQYGGVPPDVAISNLNHELRLLTKERDEARAELAKVCAEYDADERSRQQQYAYRYDLQRAEIDKVRELLLDVLREHGGDLFFDNHVSAYDVASRYLIDAGILKPISDGHHYMLAEAHTKRHP